MIVFLWFLQDSGTTTYSTEHKLPDKRIKLSKIFDYFLTCLLFGEVIYAETKDKSIEALQRLKRYVGSDAHGYEDRFLKTYRSLVHNFKYTLTHFDHQEMKRDNNLLECFNGIIKPRLDLMKGFKIQENLDRYLKLFLLEYRFHALKESRFKNRRGKSPLQVAGVILVPYHNFLTYLRFHLHFNYRLKSV